MTQLPMDERRKLAWKLIDGLKNDAALRGRLAHVVVDAATAVAEGERLSAAAEQAIIAQDKLDGRVTTMWTQMHKRHEAAWKVFMKYRSRALDTIEDAGLRKELDLNEWVSSNRPTQLMQMHDFYAKITDHAEALELLAEVNLTREKLVAARDIVAGIQAFESSIMLATSVKLAATERQTAALDALDAWREDLYARIEIVTRDAPHVRKALGMKVRG